MRAAEIGLLLPEIYRTNLDEGGPLAALLEIMSALHGSLEAAIADPPSLIDPRRAPDRLVPALAGWVGLARYLDRPDDLSADRPFPGDLRELAALGAELGRRRGSAATLVRFLETATGVAGFTVREDPRQPFHFRVTLPEAATPRRDLVLSIIHGEKPAFATFDLVDAANAPKKTEEED